jgi:hypothetical protein
MIANKLKARDTALAVGRSFGALRDGNPLVAPLASHGRLMKAVDFCTNDSLWGEQVDQGRDPYLLLEDPLNPGEVTRVAIEDRLIDSIEQGSGLCLVVLHAGKALVQPDTLVYWG